jgi:hypothetical protein
LFDLSKFDIYLFIYFVAQTNKSGAGGFKHLIAEQTPGN